MRAHVCETHTQKETRHIHAHSSPTNIPHQISFCTRILFFMMNEKCLCTCGDEGDKIKVWGSRDSWQMTSTSTMRFFQLDSVSRRIVLFPQYSSRSNFLKSETTSNTYINFAASAITNSPPKEPQKRNVNVWKRPSFKTTKTILILMITRGAYSS